MKNYERNNDQQKMKTLQAEMKEDRNKSEGKSNKNFGPSNAWGSIASVDNLS